jgi:uncharacterized small protein (DUF1192 family)
VSPQEAIDLLSIAARSATWSGASPELARELLEVLRARWDPVVQSVIDERDEARAEVERLKAERLRLLEGTEELGHEVERLRAELGKTKDQLAAERGWATNTAPVVDPRDAKLHEDGPTRDARADRPTPPERPSAFMRCNAGAHWFPGMHGAVKPGDVCDCGEKEATNERGTAMHPGLFGPPFIRARVQHTEQPMPTGCGQEVFPVALEECTSASLREILAARDLVGRQRYGSSLKTHNGRDVLRDAREELADAYVYLVQKKLEATQSGGLTWHLANALDSIELAWEQLGDAK